MKIRCKNCYRVLNENEEYCTSCGEHSLEMSEYMRTGVRKISQGEKLRTTLLFFAFIAFLGTGAISIGLSLIDGYVEENAIYNVMGKLITSMALIVGLTIVFRKELKGIFFKGNLFQTIGGLAIGIVAGAILVIVSSFLDFAKIIPQNLLDYIPLNKVSFEFFSLFFVMILVSICEEYIYRHRLINFFDEDTMLNDFWIVFFTTIISTVLSFAWFMSVKTLLMTLIINLLMSLLYINTNRSLGINIVVRCFIYFGVLLLNYFI